MPQPQKPGRMLAVLGAALYPEGDYANTPRANLKDENAPPLIWRPTDPSPYLLFLGKMEKPRPGEPLPFAAEKLAQSFFLGPPNQPSKPSAN